MQQQGPRTRIIAGGLNPLKAGQYSDPPTARGSSLLSCLGLNPLKAGQYSDKIEAYPVSFAART